MGSSVAEPFVMESFVYDGKTYNLLRNGDQMGVGHELMMMNKHNHRYVWQKNHGSDDWINAECTTQADYTVFQFSHPALEALLKDDLRDLKDIGNKVQLVRYLKDNDDLKLWDYLEKIIDELIKNTAINGKPLVDVTQPELDELLDKARQVFPELFPDEEFTFDDVLRELLDNNDYLQEYVEQFKEDIKAQLIDQIVEIVIPDLTAATVLVILGRTVTLGVLVGVYAALILTLDLDEMKEDILHYAQMYKEGFSLKCRMKGFDRQFDQQHKGGDPLYTRGRYLVNKKESDVHGIDILDLHRAYFPAMFKIPEDHVGQDYVFIDAAVIKIEVGHTLLGSLIKLHVSVNDDYGHWFKETNFNNHDINIVGKEDHEVDRWAIYIEE